MRSSPLRLPGRSVATTTTATALAFAFAFAVLPACSSPQSFVVLDLELAPGSSGPIAGITAVTVHVTQGTSHIKDLTYQAPGLAIDAVASVTTDGGASAADAGRPKTLSVDFSSGIAGTVSFRVQALGDHGCLGEGTRDVVIRKGSVAEGIVSLSAAACPSGVDGGAPDGGDGGPTFPGCDPMSPATGAGTVCTGSQVCQVDCPMLKTDCVPGGQGAPGSLCSTNADCAPGSQCFDYAGTGCAVKVCLRFCNRTADCAAFGDGGAGPGSVCEGPVQCGATVTSYHTCTFNCDPTAAAASTHGGCPGALVCVMPASMDAVDCACPEVTRTKTENQTCTGAADCVPGLICDQMNGAKTCRPICRCNAANGACTSGAGVCPSAGTTCHPVTNDTLFGVCF